MNLANKYRPNKFEDVVEQGLPVKLIKGLCDADPFESRNILLTGPAGTGKANPLYTKIFTPTGFIQMKDISVGDEVFTNTGSIGIVSGIYPQGKRDTYRIYFNDFTRLDVSDEHLNMVYFHNPVTNAHEDQILTTNELIKMFRRSKEAIYVDITSVDWPERKCTSDPYSIGKELGQLDMSNARSDIQIPNEYLFNCKNIRAKLLSGIYASLGSVISNDCIKIIVENSRLAKDIELLIRSLGYFVEVEEVCNTYFYCIHNLGIGTNPESVILSNTINITLERKIVDIRYIGEEDCQCIMVDHEDHSYICEEGLIPTHNTTLARIIGNYMNDGEGDIIEVDAASNNGVEYMRKLIDQARTYPLNSKWKVFILDEVHVLSQQSWQVLLKPLESGIGKSIFIMATTNPEKIPATIISRVQSFQLSKISLNSIISRLKYVLDQEKHEGRILSYTDDGVSYIAKLANGGMRDALTMLDKCLTFSPDITIENVCLALNIPEYDQFFDLLSAYAHKDGVAIANIIDDVYNSGTNFVRWFQNFHSFVANIMKYIYLKDISKTMIPTTYSDKLSKYGSTHLAICLNLSMKLLKLNDALKYTQYLQETALSYLAFPAKVK